MTTKEEWKQVGITLHYDVRKKGRQGHISEIGAILDAKANLLGWGVDGANCDALGSMMARRYLRDVIEELENELHEQPHTPVGVLKDQGIFNMFDVFSRRGYWRIRVTVPDNYAVHQVILDGRRAEQAQNQEEHANG